MKRLLVLGCVWFALTILVGLAMAEPYVGKEFPPKEIIAYNYDKHRKWLGFTYFKTLNIEEPGEGGWYQVRFHYNRQTPQGDRDSIDTLMIKKLDNDTWILRGKHIDDAIMELVVEDDFRSD
jgi:hypothetical protein